MITKWKQDIKRHMRTRYANSLMASKILKDFVNSGAYSRFMDKTLNLAEQRFTYIGKNNVILGDLVIEKNKEISRLKAEMKRKIFHCPRCEERDKG